MSVPVSPAALISSEVTVSNPGALSALSFFIALLISSFSMFGSGSSGELLGRLFATVSFWGLCSLYSFVVVFFPSLLYF